MDEQLNPLEMEHSLSVVLPGGQESNATVHGSTPVMDLLVTLCASYHLNPSDYTVEVLSANKNNIAFKPNSPVGSLEAETVVLKPKGVEEKIKRPYMPEATVRLLINYNKSHKAVVRVSPRAPLEMLLPVICDKCELKVQTTVLLRESQSKELLDLTKTLNEHGLREVFAKDTAAKDPVDPPRTPEAAVTPAEVISPPPLQDLPKKEKKQKENTGFLSLFRRRKKKPETEEASSAPTSPGLNKPASVSVTVLAVSPSNTLPADKPKKRRAPQPPMSVSQSAPNSLSSCRQTEAQGSAESTLRSTKRRAPPPPCLNTHQELQAGAEVKGSVDSLHSLEELRESDESDSVNLSLSSPSSPHPSQPLSFSFSSRPSLAHLHEMADPYLPTFRGKDLSDARCALAKVLTSSISKATLVRRLKNTATFPKIYNSCTFMSVTQKCPADGVYHAELESVLKSNLPTEPEWEDPVHRKRMTTFKVVPSNKHTSNDEELTLDVPDQYQITVEDDHDSVASLEDRDNQTSVDEDPCSPDRSDTETPSPSPEPCSQEILTSNGQASPPVPHDLGSQDCPGSPVSEVDEKPKEEEEPEVTSEVTRAPPCSDEEPTGQINSETPGEYPQSPSIQSLGTNTERRGSCVVEKEGEEVAQENEEEDSFPPPPPPTFYNEDIEVLPRSKPPSPTPDASATPDQSSAKLKPLDKISTAPSRFAQAVAQAVQKRTRLLSRGKGLGSLAATLPSTPTSPYQYGA